MTLPCIAMLAGTAAIISVMGIPAAWIDPVFYGLWASIIVTSGCVHLPKRVPTTLAFFLAVNAGIWSGAVTSVAGTRLDLATAFPFVLLCVPGGWLVATNRSIVIKVMASWLIAVAVLAAFIPITTPTPGYAPDHME